MKRYNYITLLIVATALAAIGRFCSPARADDFPPTPLPDNDRQVLNDYLGNDVVGEAVGAPMLAHGLNDLIIFPDGLAWRLRIISGKSSGTIQTGSLRILSRPDNQPGSDEAVRMDIGDGQNVLFGRLDAKGNFICYASQDNEQGVISRFTPAQPIVLAGMAPGEVRKLTSHVSVADLSQPDVQTHSGTLNIEFTYVGAYRLNVPAGKIDAVLFKTHLSGKVGPATVEDTIYRFLAKDRGPVAIVETEDVSAMLVYHEESRIGKVLVETIGK
jgi:hypothetical protein